jgi:hypothetical protein
MRLFRRINGVAVTITIATAFVDLLPMPGLVFM